MTPLSIIFRIQTGSYSLAINGVSAPLRSEQDIATGWQVIKAAIFAKNPERTIAKILRSA